MLSIKNISVFFVLLSFCFACHSDKKEPVPHPVVDKEIPEEVILNDEEKHKQELLKTYFSDLTKKRGFNGVVLVSQKGRTIYKDCYGFADFKTKRPLKVSTAFQLASVSKQFTAVAIMMLKEDGKLSYEDTVQKYLPELPYEGITIYQLLTHRSGVPNYTYFSEEYCTDKHSPINNDDLICYMSDYKPWRYYKPNSCFDYSNTGYAILASIVERVSGKPFEVFMKEKVFEPLDMNNSFVFKKNSSIPVKDVAIGHTIGKREIEYNYLNGVVGDKGVYSTVEDLLKWDMALHAGILLDSVALGNAYLPSNKRTRNGINYGFGWRLCEWNGVGKIAWHSGWWQGFKTCFIRVLPDKTAIIVLSNVVNKSFSFYDLPDIMKILYPEQEFKLSQ